MVIADRLGALREQKQLSQGEIERRNGLLRRYISRGENGHTVLAVETIQKLARAMEIPLYQVFYDGEGPPTAPDILKRAAADDIGWESQERRRTPNQFRMLLGRIDESDRKLLLHMAPENGHVDPQSTGRRARLRIPFVEAKAT